MTEKNEKTKTPNVDEKIYAFADELNAILCVDKERKVKTVAKLKEIVAMRGDRPIETVFDGIKRFASFITAKKGENFNAKVSEIKLTENTTLYMVEPPCGSNSYVMKNGKNLLFVDGGFNAYKKETLNVFESVLGDLSNYQKQMVVTHADLDHVGLVDEFDKVFVSEDCYNNFADENDGLPNIRQNNPHHALYETVSKLVLGYEPPSINRFEIIGKKTDGGALSKIGELKFCDLRFDVYQGAGGHVRGEIVLVDEKTKIVFTGDVLINVKEMSNSQVEFSRIAPIFMTSANENSAISRQERQEIAERFGCYSCFSGHGKPIVVKS